MILADSQVTTLGEMFIVAAVVVSPFGWWQARKVRLARERVAALRAPPPEPATTSADDDRDLAIAVARIQADVTDHDPGAEFEVELPVGATVGGRPADHVIVTSIVADSLRRDGVEIIERGEQIWRCRRPDPSR